MRDAKRGIAALGRQITNNGTHARLVLGRSLTRFFGTEMGWRLARGEI